MRERGPGWPTVLALALVVLGFAVFDPLQLILLPLALMLVAFPPRTVARVGLAVVLAALALGSPGLGLWSVERGWSLLVAGWFVLAVLAWPGGSFVGRALTAVLAAAVTGGGLIAASGGWVGLEVAMESRFRERAQAVAASLSGDMAPAEAVIERATELPVLLFPGLLAVGTVAALGVGWWIYWRLSRRGEPLGTLPEFRFPDAFVWVLIMGLVLVVVPLADWAPRVGGNVLVVMGSLYALRGLAVVVALVGAHGPVLVVLGLVALLLWPIVMMGTLVVGVTDTWWDLRAAGRAAGDEG